MGDERKTSGSRGLGRRPIRAQVRRSLARFGPSAVPALEKLLENHSLPEEVRRALPRAMAEVEDQLAVDALFRCLPNDDLRLHYQAVKSLARLRRRAPLLRFARGEVNRVLIGEITSLVEQSRLLASVRRRGAESDGARLLASVLEERVEFTRERIFRLLGLIHPQDEIAGLWNRIVGGRPSVRAAALEYLAHVVSRKHRASLLPLIERGSQPDALRGGLGLLGEPAPPFEEALAALALSTDEWLAACAVTVAGQLPASSLAPILRSLRAHPRAVVREAALHALPQRE